MRVPPAAPLTLLLLLLLPGLGLAQASGGVDLSAGRDADGNVVADVRAYGAPLEGSLLVTHSDPLAGTVVDWMTPLQVAAGETAHLVLKGLREDKPLLLRVLAAGDGPAIMPRSRMYVGSSADGLRALAISGVPAVPGPSLVDADAKRVTRGLTDGEAYGEARVVVTRDGMLVLGWHQDNALHAAWSADGGHTFSQAQAVSLGSEPGPFDWGMGETSDGDVSFVYHAMANESRAWGMTRVDPVSGAIAYGYQNGAVDVGSQRARVVVLPDGGALVLAPRYEWGQDKPFGVQIWRLFEQAPVKRLADVPFADRQTLDVRAAVEGDRVAVAFVTVWSPVPNRAYVALSTDGGLSFGAPVELSDVDRQSDHGVLLGDLAFDAEGTLHLAAAGYAGEELGGLAFYVRRASDGTFATKRLAAASGHSPRVSVAGARVWVAWDESGVHLAESTDGGRTFGPTHTPVFEGGFVPYLTLATFPSGHPVFAGKRFGDEPSEGWAVGPLYDPYQREDLFLARTTGPGGEGGMRLDSSYVPPQATPGQRVEVLANYTWRGASAVTVRATLVVDGVAVQTHTHEMAAGSSAQTAFQLDAPGPGDHQAHVSVSPGGDFPDSALRVAPPPAPRFSVEDPRAPARVRVGDPVEVTGVVRNDGEAAGVAEVYLRVNGAIHGRAEVPVEARSWATARFEYTPTQEGRYEARLFLPDGQTSAAAMTVAGNDPVSGSARFQLGPLRADAEVAAGRRANASVRVTNAGDAAGDARVELLLDGAVVDRVTLPLAAGASRTARFSFVAPTEGSHALSVRVGDGPALDPVTRDVLPAPPGDRVEVTFVPAELVIPPGGEARLTLVVRNRGAEPVRVRGLDFRGLPQGVVVDLSAARSEVGAGATWEMPLVLTAEPGAPETSAATRVAVVDSEGADAGASPLTVHVASGDAPVLVPQPGPEGVDGVTMALASGAGAVGLAGLALWLRRDAGRWLLGAAALPLYTRMKRGDVLQNPVRAGVYAHVQQNPGVGFEELRRALGLGNGALVFHLRVLEREGHVRCVKQWSRRTYWATGAAGVPKTDLHAHDAIALALRQEPASPSAVAQRLGISRQLARYHLRALERRGVVQAEGEGPAQRYRLRQG